MLECVYQCWKKQNKTLPHRANNNLAQSQVDWKHVYFSISSPLTVSFCLRFVMWEDCVTGYLCSQIHVSLFYTLVPVMIWIGCCRALTFIFVLTYISWYILTQRAEEPGNVVQMHVFTWHTFRCLLLDSYRLPILSFFSIKWNCTH